MTKLPFDESEIEAATTEEILRELSVDDIQDERMFHVCRNWRDNQLPVRSADKAWVLVNGCFDLLHAGHAYLFAWARLAARRLLKRRVTVIAAVNSDASVRRLKGSPRPYMRFSERLFVLSSLRDVDVVVGFNEDTPAELIRFLQPDVLVKGDEYRDREIPGGQDVTRTGGRVILAPMYPGLSTTELVRHIHAVESRGS